MFDRSISGDRDDVVLCDLGHPLVVLCRCACCARRWCSGRRRKLSSATARRVSPVPDVLDDGDIAAICHARLVITGADGYRLHQELVVAGGR